MQSPSRAADRVFWCTFVVAVFAPASLAVLPGAKTQPLDANVIFAFITVGALLVPAGLIAVLLSRPMRVDANRGHWLSAMFAVIALGCAIAAAIAWARHPFHEVTWPLTRALWHAWGDAAFLLLPVFLLTGLLDVFIMLAVAIALSLAPALVPAFGALAGVALSTLVASVVRRVRARKVAFACVTSTRAPS